MLQNLNLGAFVMKRGFVALLLLSVAIAASAQPMSSNAAQLSRGKYLVEQVGMCADCHSPRNERGEFLTEQWLAGSPLAFKPTVPVPGWVEVAPGIAGLPGWNDKDAIAFLSTGKGLNGKVTGPPMPEFRFTQADAAAVVAYLKSLKPQSAPGKSPTVPKMPKKRSGM
jgi:mono/diheme cytochrome c family protein